MAERTGRPAGGGAATNAPETGGQNEGDPNHPQREAGNHHPAQQQPAQQQPAQQHPARGGDGQQAGPPAPVTIETLVQDHHVVIYRYAYRLSGEVANAEDLTQQTFLVAQQKLPQLRDGTRARSWLLTITRTLFLKECRRPRMYGAAEHELQQVADATPSEGAVDPEELQEALRQLPAEQRAVLLMFYFEELSYREIAEQLEIKMGTVMSRLARAKERLRLLLESAGPPDGSAGQVSSQPDRRSAPIPTPDDGNGIR